MSMRNEILAASQQMRIMPVAALDALRLLHQPDVETEKIVAVIERDPGWTANLLRLANSAFFGCPRSVRTVRDAFLRLGLRNMAQLMIGSAMIPILRGTIASARIPGVTLWQHSLAVAMTTNKLATATGVEAPNQVFTAAVLHDIGKVVIEQAAGFKMVGIMEVMARQKIPETVAERMVLGIDHAEVGQLLLTNWNLPPEVIEIVRRHHETHELKDTAKPSHLVYLADMAACIAESRENIDDNYVSQFTDQITNRLRLTKKNALELVEGVSEIHAQGGEAMKETAQPAATANGNGGKRHGL